MAAAVAAALVLVGGLTGAMNCDPAAKCLFTHTDTKTGKVYKYDMTSGCSSTDYVGKDEVGHT